MTFEEWMDQTAEGWRQFGYRYSEAFLRDAWIAAQNLAQAAEREACAVVADGIAKVAEEAESTAYDRHRDDHHFFFSGRRTAATNIAAAIRARGGTDANR
jgi:hypothetical protein